MFSCRVSPFRSSLSRLMMLAGVVCAAANSAAACPDINGIADLNCDGRITVLCFGDSITKGEQDSTGLGYPGRLEVTYLNSPSAKVINRGVGGETTSIGRNRAASDFGRKFPGVDYAIVLEGVNDYFASGHSVSSTRSNLSSIVRSARNSGAVTLLSKLTDVRRSNQRPWVVSVNSAIGGSTQIDFFSLGTSILASDGLHPKGPGYQLMAGRVYAALQAASAASRPADTDGDGIYDFEESRYATSPNLADTDGDGLNDFEEVFTYKTNPLVADTDGDGFTDGDEVKNRHTDPVSTVPVAPVITKLEPVVVAP